MNSSLPNPEQVFSGELLSGESILWSGQPDPSLLFTSKDFYLVPFSILWAGFALFWEASALGLTSATQGNAAPLPFALFGMIFVCIGLYMVIGRFFYKSWKKKRTWYAVTNRRILIVTRAPYKKFVAADMASLPFISKSARANGAGTLEFAAVPPLFSAYQNTGLDFVTRGLGPDSPAFYDIRDVRQVYDLINQQRATISASKYQP